MADAAISPNRTKRVRLEHDERRQLILATARELFCTRPYSEISMHELAEAAGVARGLLHHYFGSKRDLYLDVVRDLTQVPALPLPDARASVPTEQLWEAAVDGWMASMEANRDLWLTIVRAGSTGRDPEIEAILDESREQMIQQVLHARRIDRASITPEVRGLVAGYGGLAVEVTREWLERKRLSREQTRAILLEALPLLLDKVLPIVESEALPA